MSRENNKENIDSWLKYVVLIPKLVGVERLEGEARDICVQSVLAKLVLLWVLEHLCGHFEM